MPKAYYPALDGSGWCTTPTTILDAVMADFYACDNSQSYLFAGSVTSLAWIIQENKGDMTNTANSIRLHLETMLRKYFDGATVDASPKETTSALSGEIYIYVGVRDGEETLTYYQLLTLQDGRMADVKKMLNSEVTSS